MPRPKKASTAPTSNIKFGDWKVHSKTPHRVIPSRGGVDVQFIVAKTRVISCGSEKVTEHSEHYEEEHVSMYKVPTGKELCAAGDAIASAATDAALKALGWQESLPFLQQFPRTYTSDLKDLQMRGFCYTSSAGYIFVLDEDNLRTSLEKLSTLRLAERAEAAISTGIKSDV